MKEMRATFEPTQEDKRKILELITVKYNKKKQEVINQPQVLLAGQSGAGKSSLVNAIFGDPNLCKTGTGKAVTSKMSKIGGSVGSETPTPGTPKWGAYDPLSDKDLINTKRPIIIHDTKGLETGQGETEKYIQANLEYISKQNIHVVWYVVGVGVSRFLDGDLHLIHDLYSKFPVIIVLNKVDQVEKEKAMELEKSIKDMIIEYETSHDIKTNVKAIVKTSANIYDKERRTVYMYKKCVKCGSDRTMIDTFECTGICRNKECGYVQSIRIQNGLEELVDQTLKVLPEVVQNTFICEQQVALKIKDLIARDTIKRAVDKAGKDYTSIFTQDSIVLIIDLSEIFGMQKSGEYFASTIYDWFSKEIVGESAFSKLIFTTSEFISRIFKNLTNSQMILACEGLFWYYVFRKNYVKNLTIIEEVDDENFVIYEKYWKILNENGSIDETLDVYFDDLLHTQNLKDSFY
jgi:predicted GTPase